MPYCIKLVVERTTEAADDAKTKAKLIMTIDSALCVHIKGATYTFELYLIIRDLREGYLCNLISIRFENYVSTESFQVVILVLRNGGLHTCRFNH